MKKIFILLIMLSSILLAQPAKKDTSTAGVKGIIGDSLATFRTETKILIGDSVQANSPGYLLPSDTSSISNRINAAIDSVKNKYTKADADVRFMQFSDSTSLSHRIDLSVQQIKDTASAISQRKVAYGDSSSLLGWYGRPYLDGKFALKANLASPTFTGTVTAPTVNATTAIQLNGTNINMIYAPINNPTFTGILTSDLKSTGFTSGYVPYYNGTKLVNSGIYTDGTNYSIGTTSLAYKLCVRSTLDDVLNIVSTRDVEGASLLNLHANSGIANVADGDSNTLTFYLDSDTTPDAMKASIKAVSEDVTHATRLTGLGFSTQESGTAIATEHMRITGAGNVGIGNVADNGAGILQLSGNIVPYTNLGGTSGTSSYRWTGVYAGLFNATGTIAAGGSTADSAITTTTFHATSNVKFDNKIFMVKATNDSTQCTTGQFYVLPDGTLKRKY